MPAPTTIDPDTELSAVNTILGAIGQAPITTLDYDSATDTGAFENPEIAFIYNIFKECNVDVQNEGWHFNKEEYVKKEPDANKEILVGNNILRMDFHDPGNRDHDIIIKSDNGVKKLYDKLEVNSTSNTPFEFDDEIYVDIVYLYEFVDIPSVFQRYITYKAAARAATQLVGNSTLVQLLTVQEQNARANCMEYECNQGDHSFFGHPRENTYHSYKPYKSLRR